MHANPAEVIGLFTRLHTGSKRDLPIRNSDMGVLMFLRHEGRGVRPVEVAEHFRVSKAAASTMIKRLHVAGYVEKNATERDGRSVQLFLSLKGKAFVEETVEQFLSVTEKLENGLGTERFIQLIRLLEDANEILGRE